MLLSNFLLNIENEIEKLINAGAILQKIALPESLKSLYCYQLSKANTKGTIIAGLGADFDQKLAYVKCLVEFVERKAFYEIGINAGFSSTNGIAGHLFMGLAKKHAYAELLERDSFLLHWYGKVPFLKIEHSNTLVLNFQNSIPNYNVQFYKTFLGEMTTYCCCITNTKTMGFVIGLSSGKKNLNAEIEKSFSEAVINLYYGSGGPNSKTYDGFSLKTLSDHRNYWLQRPLPNWVNTPIDPGKIIYKKLPHTTVSSFNEKYGKISVCGLIKTNLLGIKVGWPDENDSLQLKMRVRFPDHITNITQSEPHPIP